MSEKITENTYCTCGKFIVSRKGKCWNFPKSVKVSIHGDVAKVTCSCGKKTMIRLKGSNMR